jgi:hypothetical protein
MFLSPSMVHVLKCRYLTIILDTKSIPSFLDSLHCTPACEVGQVGVKVLPVNTSTTEYRMSPISICQNVFIQWSHQWVVSVFIATQTLKFHWTNFWNAANIYNSVQSVMTLFLSAHIYIYIYIYERTAHWFIMFQHFENYQHLEKL